MNLLPAYSVCLDKLVLNLKSDQLFNHAYITTLPVRGNAHYYNKDISFRLDLVRTQKTSNFLYVWEVWISGERAGSLSTDCKLPQSTVTQRFSFENFILYTAPGWAHYLNILTAATGLHCYAVALVEIALDFQPQDPALDARALLYDLDDIYKYLPRDYNAGIRYRPIQARLSIEEEEGTYYFGKRVTLPNSSGKQIAVYCKSDEIITSGKEYISAYHRLNGLDTERPIVRVEVRYNIKQLRLPFFDATGSFDPEWFDAEHLESLFKEGVGRSFQFRDLTRPERDMHRHLKYPIVTLMDFDFLREIPMERPECFDPQRANDRANASTVKGLVQEFIKHGASETIAELKRFIHVNPAPGRTNWNNRIERYAYQYTDAPNPEQMQRLESILQQLK